MASSAGDGDDVAERHEDAHDVIVRYVIASHLRRKGYQWPDAALLPAQSCQHEPICEAVDALCQEFRTQFGEKLVQMCDELKVTAFGPSVASNEFASVMNELFNEGIKWSRIVAMLAFGVQLAEHCADSGHMDYVDSIVEWMTSYVDEHLLTWIKDHGGWEGILTFANDRRSSNSPWPGLNFFAGIAALGAIAIGAVLASKS